MEVRDDTIEMHDGKMIVFFLRQPHNYVILHTCMQSMEERHNGRIALYKSFYTSWLYISVMYNII